MSDAEEKVRWAERFKAQGWAYYRAAFTHGRQLWEHALIAFEQAEGLLRDAATPRAREGLIGVLSGKGSVLRSTGDPEGIRQALGLYREEIALLREFGRERELPEALVNVALACRDLATVDPTRAAELSQGVAACREALETARRLDRPEAEALAANTLGDLCLVLARLDLEEYRDRHAREAVGFYGQAEKLWQDRDEDGVTLARMGLAEAYITLGQNLEGARDLLEEALRYYRDYSGRPVSGPVRYQIAQVKELEARLYEAEGKVEDAARARREARESLESLGFGQH